MPTVSMNKAALLRACSPEQAEFLMRHAEETTYRFRTESEAWKHAEEEWGAIQHHVPRTETTAAPNPIQLALSALPFSQFQRSLEATVESFGKDKVMAWAKESLSANCKCMTKKKLAREALKLLGE